MTFHTGLQSKKKLKIKQLQKNVLLSDVPLLLQITGYVFCFQAHKKLFKLNIKTTS